MSDELETPGASPEGESGGLGPVGTPPLGTPAAEPVVAAIAEEPVEPAATPFTVEASARFRFQFGLVWGLLGVAIAAAIAAVVVGVVGPAVSAPPAWANWIPPSGSNAKVENAIASHVGGEYRQSKGGPPLVDVIAEAPQVTNGTTKIAVSVIAIKSATATNGYLTFLTNDMWTDQLCGLGTECSIDHGTSTQQREQTVRREALELALYTFKYTGLTSLVAYMPPPAGSPPGELLFFQKSTYAKELNQPLDKTLTLVPPPLPTQTDPSSKMINSLTLPEVYSYQPALLQDGSAALVLSPLAAAS